MTRKNIGARFVPSADYTHVLPGLQDHPKHCCGWYRTACYRHNHGNQSCKGGRKGRHAEMRLWLASQEIGGIDMTIEAGKINI